MERTCKKCGETKPIEEFARSIECKNGYRYTCKICLNKSHLKPLSQKIIDRIDLFRMGLKKCCICKKTKQLSDFYPRNVTADGLTTDCKKCNNKRGQEYKNNNKEKIRIKQNEWELKNLYKRVGYGRENTLKTLRSINSEAKNIENLINRK